MKKEKSRSITLRLFSTVFLAVLLLNILSVAGVLALSALSRKNVIQEYTYALQLYINQLDRELGQAQTRLYDLSRSFEYRFSMSGSDSGADPYEILRSQVAVNNTLDGWLVQFPMIDGYYIYQEDTGLQILCADDSAAAFGLSRELENTRNDARSEQSAEKKWQDILSEPDGRWTLLDIPEGPVIAFAASHADTVYGAWIQTGRLFEEWGISRDNIQRYRILPSGSQLQSGSVDAVSNQADCMLRYSLPPEDTTVPAGVRILLGASIVMLLALPVVWFSLRKLVILPIRSLTEAIHHIESGDTGYRIPEKTTSSEFDRLNMQFNSSLDQIENMHEQVYESRMEKERIYINYLSQQMQPHFVLNTLNLIFSMEPEEYDLIQETVACLADYYRYIAHINDPMVPVSAELAHVENYFKLQQIRYPEMFFYSIQCPDHLKQVKIPPIIIQTFAENAIKHSLVVGEENRVSIMLEETGCRQVHIMIRDHGKGYPDEILEKIRKFRETGIHQEGLGLGIQNTIERIRLIYQNQADLTFQNAQDGGAMIHIYLPMAVQADPEAPEDGVVIAAPFTG